MSLAIALSRAGIASEIVEADPDWRIYGAGIVSSKGETLYSQLSDAPNRIAFDLEHPSWDGVEPRLAEAGAVRVNDLEGDAPFRFLRLRDPPYDDAVLVALADRIRPLTEPVYVYFRHEDEPTAPTYAQRLLELLR